MLAWVMNLGFAASPAGIAPPPPPPAAGGSVPGFVPGGKKKRKEFGPYMRDGQVFGEQYPYSPDLGSVPLPKIELPAVVLPTVDLRVPSDDNTASTVGHHRDSVIRARSARRRARAHALEARRLLEAFRSAR